jgi:tetratricopeptide (TPR) repeat protein
VKAEELGRRYYRLGLGAAKRRDLRAALAYARCALLLDQEHRGAIRLAEICRLELGETGDTWEPELESALSRIALEAGQKKWKAAALAAKDASCQSVRLLTIQGCLWALAKRYGPAMDCFAKALAKDHGNILAAEALAELGRRRRFLGGFFVPL